MAKYAEDRFDELPDDIERVGAHRGPPPRSRAWITLAWALLLIGVLVFAGLFALSRFLGDDLGIPFFATAAESTASPTEEPEIPQITDPSTIAPERAIIIDVLNGTSEDGLQDTVLDKLAAEGWPTGSAAPASERDIEKTYIYFSNNADEDIARGLSLVLGTGELGLVEPDAYPGVPITIVLGNDYLAFAPAADAPAEEPVEESTE